MYYRIAVIFHNDLIELFAQAVHLEDVVTAACK